MKRDHSRFEEMVRARVPRELKTLIEKAAEAEFCSESDWVRRACLERLRATATPQHNEAANDNIAASEIRMSA
jgi:uncharacterized protein (DUF1778 family)